MDQSINQFPSIDQCPLLSSQCNWRHLFHSTYKGFNLPIKICETCGLKAQYPLLKDWKSLYGEEYYNGIADYSYIDERREYNFHAFTWDSRLDKIESEWSKRFSDNPQRKLRFLEIGSSFGGFLSRAQKRGHSVQGIEFSRISSQYANENGINTHQGTLEDTNFPHGSFDVIVLSEVIEHLPNPQTSLNRISELMSNHSIIVIQTANFEGWQAVHSCESYHYFLPGHLFYYGEKILIDSLEIRGIREFKVYYGSDVSLISKLRKMRGGFKKPKDYFRWIPTIIYHFKSRFKLKGRPITSGFVLYGFKSE